MHFSRANDIQHPQIHEQSPKVTYLAIFIRRNSLRINSIEFLKTGEPCQFNCLVVFASIEFATGSLQCATNFGTGNSNILHFTDYQKLQGISPLFNS